MDIKNGNILSEKKKEEKRQLLGIRILENCRNELCGKFPYLEGAFTGLRCEADRQEAGIGSDGERLLFSPDFLLRKYSENPSAIRRGYLHILLHCLYLHPFLKASANERVWNLACDICVEQVLDQEEESCILDERRSARQQNLFGKKKVFSVQQISRILEESCSEKQLKELEALYVFDDHEIWKACDGGARRKKWEQLRAYTTQSREKNPHRAGVTSGNRTDEIQEISGSRYDYRRFLRQFCTMGEEAELDMESFDYIFYTYGMTNYESIPFIEPLEYREVNKLEELVIAIDTSGSCSVETVRHFLEETYSILSTRENFFRKMTVHILQCDCCILSTAVIHSEEEWMEYSKNVKIEGRGGTDFRPVFQYILKLQQKKELKKLKALIYFTDGDGIYPMEKPEYETAFVFLKHTDAMKAVPPWALKLIVNE